MVTLLLWQANKIAVQLYFASRIELQQERGKKSRNVRTLIREFIAILKEAKAEVQWPLGSKPRNLSGRLKMQSTEAYWRNRERAASGRRRVIAYRHRVGSLVDLFQQDIGIIGSAVIPLLRAFFGGAILLAALLLAEFCLARYVWPTLIPSGNSIPPLGAFPTLAVQISASLLGFYLASVSIVLGQSYSNVSADVRELVLGSPRVRLYLKLVGFAIGAGLTLILLRSVGASYGYVTLAGYVFWWCSVAGHLSDLPLALSICSTRSNSVKSRS